MIVNNAPYSALSLKNRGPKKVHLGRAQLKDFFNKNWAVPGVSGCKPPLECTVGGDVGASIRGPYMKESAVKNALKPCNRLLRAAFCRVT